MDRFIPKHGGNINEEAKRLGLRPNELLDASASLVPFPLPKKLKRCLQKAITNYSLLSYPDCNHHYLKQAIAAWHKIDPSMILPGNGASELFTWAARDVANIGQNCIPTPGFADYIRALKCWDASFIRMPLPLSWKSKTRQPFPIDPKGMKTIWITNPHNPTGQLWSKESLEDLLKKNYFVICDEAFLPLVKYGEKESLVPLVVKYKNLIVIRSLTKLFALPGLRLGYAISNSERLEIWRKWRDPWPVNGIAIAAGTLLMSDSSFLKDWTNKVQNWVELEGEWLYNNLNSLAKIKAHPSSANFILIEGNDSLTSTREKLSHQKILLRDCRSFDGLGEKWLRISLQSRRNNHRIINSLKSIIK